MRNGRTARATEGRHESSSSQSIPLEAKLQRSTNVRRPGVIATPVQRKPSLAHQEEESSDDEHWLAPKLKDKGQQARINWTRLMKRYIWLMSHAAQGRMFEKWDETRYETDATQVQYAAPTPKSKPTAKAKRPERRDDLCYIGRALPPNNGKGRRHPFTSTPDLCRGTDGVPHREYLTATGGTRGSGQKTFSWLCQNCGARFERTDLQNATDGAGHAQERQNAAGPILPRSAAEDLQAQAIASSQTIRPLEQHLAALPPQAAAEYLQAVQTAVMHRENPQVFNLAENEDDMVDEGQGTISASRSTFPDADPNDPDL